MQLAIEARDQGLPQKKDRTTVNVFVKRNINSPVFETPVVNISLPENRAVGTVVASMEAKDADGVCLHVASKSRVYFTQNSNNSDDSIYRILSSINWPKQVPGTITSALTHTEASSL